MKTSATIFALLVMLILGIATLFIIQSNDIVGQNKAAVLEIQGGIMQINCDGIAGWAWNSQLLGINVKIKAYADGDVLTGKLIYTGLANQATPTLAKAITGTEGKFGFNVTIPVQYKDNKEHKYYIYAEDFYISSKRVLLENTYKQLTCA